MKENFNGKMQQFNIKVDETEVPIDFIKKYEKQIYKIIKKIKKENKSDGVSIYINFHLNFIRLSVIKNNKEKMIIYSNLKKLILFN